MEPINITRFQNKVRAIYGMRGGNPIPTIAELQPILAIEVDRPEWGYAAREDSFGVFASQAGVAGNFGFVGLFNPANSGVIAVVEFAKNISSIAVLLTCGAEVLPANTQAVVFGNRDTRRHDGLPAATQPPAACRLLTGTAAAFAANQAHWQLGVTATLEAQTPPRYHAVISAGGWWVALGGVVNTTITTTFMWRERNVEREKGS